MPITMLPPTKERTWPKDLDRLAMLDMKGLLPHKRPDPVTPPLAPVKPRATQPDEPCHECAILQRKIAQMLRRSQERTRRNAELTDRVRRRDCKIETLQKALQRSETTAIAAERREATAERVITNLQKNLIQKDDQVKDLRAELASVTAELEAARKALGVIKLRAHDWLELREGKRVVREINQGKVA